MKKTNYRRQKTGATIAREQLEGEAKLYEKFNDFNANLRSIQK